jgi:hypothetical protein
MLRANWNDMPTRCDALPAIHDDMAAPHIHFKSFICRSMKVYSLKRRFHLTCRFGKMPVYHILSPPAPLSSLKYGRTVLHVVLGLQTSFADESDMSCFVTVFWKPATLIQKLESQDCKSSGFETHCGHADIRCRHDISACPRDMMA